MNYDLVLDDKLHIHNDFLVIFLNNHLPYILEVPQLSHLILQALSLELVVMVVPLLQSNTKLNQMTELLCSKELVFRPNSDQSLTGNLTFTNQSRNFFIPFKIKSTNPSLFSVDPINGIIKPGESLNVKIDTYDAINDSMAKELSLKHKFLVQYILCDKQPADLSEGIHRLKSLSCQSTKIFINTDFIRNSRISSPGRQESVRSSLSNKQSYHTVMNGQNFKQQRNRLSTFPVSHQPKNTSLQQLKNEIYLLEQQKSQLLFGGKNKKNKGSGWIKKLIVMIIGLIIGNTLSNTSGFSEVIRADQKKDQGFFSFIKQEDQQDQSWF